MTGSVLAKAEHQPGLQQLTRLARSLADGLASAVSCGTQRRPDPAPLVRAYLRARRRRDHLFGFELFADPVWDVLLDLYASGLEARRVCISDACIAANVPPTTALRWLGKMEECRLIVRRQDDADARRVYLELSPHAAKAVETWLERFLGDMDSCDAELGTDRDPEVMVRRAAQIDRNGLQAS